MANVRYRDIPRSPEYPHMYVGGECAIGFDADYLPLASIYTGDFCRVVGDEHDGQVSVDFQTGPCGVSVAVTALVMDAWNKPAC